MDWWWFCFTRGLCRFLPVAKHISAETISFALKDVITWLQLSLNDCRCQCYDGKNNMLGKRSGVAKRIQDEQPKAHVTHCHCHSLSLGVKDTTIATLNYWLIRWIRLRRLLNWSNFHQNVKIFWVKSKIISKVIGKTNNLVYSVQCNTLDCAGHMF